MANYCPNCGSPVNGGLRFCPQCGQPIAAATQPVQPAHQPQNTVYAGNGAIRLGVPAPGFSDRVNHPEILAAVKKQRKSAKVFAFFLVPLPIVGFVIYSRVSGSMELGAAIKYGTIVSAVFLLFALLGLTRERAENTYDAVVTDKKARAVTRHSGDQTEVVTEYITFARTDDGKTKKIVENDRGRRLAWEYLDVGVRFRCHPQFSFPYERYNKATAPCLYCVRCQAKNPVTADRCKKCNLPLLK